jgi:exopolyphosphatase/guanosine-5'-triphosphate,3'-diphosphate pyrophosphatase
VVLAAGGVINQVYSLPLGAVRLTERYVKSDPLTDKHWKKMRGAIDRAIDEEIGKPALPAEVMFGSGGTFTNLGEMVQCEREGRSSLIRGYVMTRADLARLLGRLRETPLGARRRMCALNPKRADIIVAGAAAVTRLVKRLGTQRIIINDRGIRDGLIVSMIEDISAEGAASAPVVDRMTWVREFARRCRSNERHCNQVALLALQLFDALCEPLEIPASGRDILEAAALLHDVGYLINHSKHHKHAYHLIMHGDLRGFSPGEVEMIANVARYHRRAMPKRSHENFAKLDKADRRLVRQLAGILRVAEGLDRTHGQMIKLVTAEVDEDTVHLTVDAEANPQVEIADGLRKSPLFRETFDVDLTIEWSRRKKRRAERSKAKADNRKRRRNAATRKQG